MVKERATVEGLHNLFAEILDVEKRFYDPQKSVDYNFTSLDADSMLKLEALAEIERRHLVVISEEDYQNKYLPSTLEQLAAYINGMYQ